LQAQQVLLLPSSLMILLPRIELPEEALKWMDAVKLNDTVLHTNTLLRAATKRQGARLCSPEATSTANDKWYWYREFIAQKIKV